MHHVARTYASMYVRYRAKPNPAVEDTKRNVGVSALERYTVAKAKRAAYPKIPIRASGIPRTVE